MLVDKNNPLSVTDHDTVMRVKGYIMGYYGSSILDLLVLLYDDIRSKTGDYLQDAKGISITFYCANYCDYEKLSGRLEKIMGRIKLLVNEDTNIVHSFEIDDRISTGVVEYKVLLSGINKI